MGGGGGDWLTRSYVEVSPRGHFSLHGVLKACPAGTYGETEVRAWSSPSFTYMDSQPHCSDIAMKPPLLHESRDYTLLSVVVDAKKGSTALKAASLPSKRPVVGPSTTVRRGQGSLYGSRKGTTPPVTLVNTLMMPIQQDGTTLTIWGIVVSVGLIPMYPTTTSPTPLMRTCAHQGTSVIPLSTLHYTKATCLSPQKPSAHASSAHLGHTNMIWVMTWACVGPVISTLATAHRIGRHVHAIVWMGVGRTMMCSTSTAPLVSVSMWGMIWWL